MECFWHLHSDGRPVTSINAESRISQRLNIPGWVQGSAVTFFLNSCVILSGRLFAVWVVGLQKQTERPTSVCSLNNRVLKGCQAGLSSWSRKSSHALSQHVSQRGSRFFNALCRAATEQHWQDKNVLGLSAPNVGLGDNSTSHYHGDQKVGKELY